MKSKTWCLAGLASAVLLAAALAIVPPAGVCVTPAGVYIQGWWSALARRLFWPAEAVLLAGGFALSRLAGRRLAGTRWQALAPLAWLPALVALPHGLVPWDHTLAGLVLPLGGTFLAAVCAERILRPALDEPQGAPGQSLRVSWAWFGAALVFLLAFHFGVASLQGFGSGDVKHYWIQVENLVERGNLDLTDRMEALMDAAGVPDDPETRLAWLHRSHMRVNAAGHVYSYHTFGFPLLAWPFFAILGPLGKGVWLALIGAIALCGVRAACLAHGAPRVAADTVSLLTGLSYVWVYTAMSFLPEMLGFAFVAWGFWAVAAQTRPGWRWGATAVAVLVCSYLPLAHIRFTPAAGMLAASFGVEGLFVRDEPFWRRKFPRLAVFSLLCAGSWLALWTIQTLMFRGTATYNYSGIAGRTPLVMWAMFSDRRGSVSLVPAVSAFLAAGVVALFRRDAIARRAAMALSVVAATLWFYCCTTVAMGGACLNGRYFYPAIPVLLPFFAIALGRATGNGRRWLLFLALLPVLYFLFLPWFLNGSRLVRAPVAARGFMNLALLWEPFPSFFGRGNPRSAPELLVAGSVFSASLFGLSFLACTKRGPSFFRGGAAVVLLALAFVCGRKVDLGAPPERIGVFEVLMGTRHFHDFRIIGPHPDGVFESFREPGGDPRLVYVLTDDETRPHDDAYRLQHPSDLRVDDWRGRPLRWGKAHASLMSLKHARGVVACRATGRVVRGTARLALQIGGLSDATDIVLPEGPFDVVFRTRVPRGNEGANFRLALENDVGEAYIATTEYIPCPGNLPDLLGGYVCSDDPGATPVRLVETL